MYCILRPQNLAMDLPDEPDVPAEPRNLEDGPLTDAEKEALASIQPSEWSKSDGVNLDKLYPFLYEKAMIDVTLTDGYVAKTVHSVFNYLFTKPSGETYYALKAVDESDPAIVYYHRIQFVECYGGTLFASDAKLADASLQIGDLFCARLRTKVDNTNEDRYWIGLYQGNGNFLVVYTNLEKESKCEVMTASSIDSNTFQYYFVLRPSNVLSQ